MFISLLAFLFHYPQPSGKSYLNIPHGTCWLLKLASPIMPDVLLSDLNDLGNRGSLCLLLVKKEEIDRRIVTEHLTKIECMLKKLTFKTSLTKIELNSINPEPKRKHL